MTRRAHALFLSLALVLPLLVAVATRDARAQLPVKTKVVVRAGYGEADATWHVGAGAGQYTAKSPDQTELVAGGDVDPHAHSTTQHDSYGVHSRLSYRAIVVQDREGDQVAFVKSDSYLAQDYLSRRVGQILEEEGSAVSYDEILHMASHNHSSPYYQSPSWGVWIFQDAFDLRAFEYHARQMAAAILEAEDNLVPARMGATTVTHRIFKGMIARKGIGDDGTPVGYPDDFGDLGLSVLRFDDMTNQAAPKPLATLINWGQHPEGLDDHDLITGDFVAPLERFVERATGAPLVFGQGDVGSAEAGPGRPDLVPAGIPKRWSHAGHAQAERGAFLLSQDVVNGWNQIGTGQGLVPYSTNFDVEAGNAWVPGPLSHPYPSFANCRTGAPVEGEPRAPGTPTCQGSGTHDRTSMMWENLRAHGLPLPEHYSPPAFTGVEENLRLRLQAFKLGEVILASCACEAQVDLIVNFESRADEQQGNIWHGYDWTERLGCTQTAPGGSWTCKDPRNESRTIAFSDARYRRMKAQIHNDARGWDAPENAPTAESEPGDPAKIFGNFTHEELPASLGYKLPIGVGHAGDYNGYTVSYREYMAYDHYRKALTAYGPHTADYMVTRLVKLAGELNGGPELEPELHDALAQVDEARQVAASTALGAASSAAYEAWVSALPDDAGPAEATDQPEDVKRFGAAYFSWRGGSNAADNPVVRVERLVDGAWRTFADQTGEVQTMVEFPDGMDGLLNTYAGDEEWTWTAGFEAFDAFPVGIGSTPAGEYRFVVDGHIRQDGEPVPYQVESQPFEVKPWDGVEVTDLRIDPGAVSFRASSNYPRTYEGSPFPYVRVETKDDVTGVPFCTTCSFRPWATSGSIVSASVTVVRSTGTVEVVPAQLVDGRWTAPVELLPGDSAFVDAGAVVDEHGERNAAPSATVTP
ncbi:MAG: neutral/alkaline non-lysosomal ceramidase N-terminal domain-containing protein [Actinomycetota bacterium]|nr:neutral/alkaline non-lysosomal ceramidase N-terminal domain-containing protein [Actinomycetota bacterium]